MKATEKRPDPAQSLKSIASNLFGNAIEAKQRKGYLDIVVVEERRTIRLARLAV